MDKFRLLLWFMVTISFLFSPPSLSAIRVGDANIDFPFKATDTTIILDDLPDTDRYVGNEKQGADLTFDFDIQRYIGDLDKLRQNRLIEEYATISLAVFDVDNASEGATLERDCDGDGELETVAYEINEVYLNGQKIGVLKSGNDQWSLNSGTKVPVELLNFPNSQGVGGQNKIEVHVDTGNETVVTSSEQVGCMVWKAEVDFVTIKFNVIDPFILLPGIGGSETSLVNSNYKSHLMNKYGIPSEIISYPPPNIKDDPFAMTYFNCADVPVSFDLNKEVILPQIASFASEWKTDSINIAAHSKGGLESLTITKAMNIKEEVKIYSANINNTLEEITLKVNTISSHASPFLGARIADKLKGSATYFGKRIADYEVFENAQNFVPQLCDLSTKNAVAHSSVFDFREDIAQFKIASDAHASGGNWLSASDLAGNQIQNIVLGHAAWKITGGTDIKDQEFKKNDTMVTQESAASSAEATKKSTHYVLKNHGTVIDEEMQESVIIQFMGRVLPWSYDHE